MTLIHKYCQFTSDRAAKFITLKVLNHTNGHHGVFDLHVFLIIRNLDQHLVLKFS